MTDNEIIKAFELCLKCEDFIGCRECPAINNGHNTIPKCRLALFNNALDLITRQQAEIERLKEFIVETRRCDKEIKSEAVKEFAERLKNEIINDTAYACDSTQHSGYYDYQIKIGDIPEYIDNLVKEMVGENND